MVALWSHVILRGHLELLHAVQVVFSAACTGWAAKYSDNRGGKLE